MLQAHGGPGGAGCSVARRRSGDSGCGCLLVAVVVWAIIVQGSLERITKFLGVSAYSDWPFYMVFFGVPVVLLCLLAFNGWSRR